MRIPYNGVVMLPVLVSIGPVKVYAMGVMLFVGLFFGLYYWWKLGRDEHWDEIALFDGYFFGLIFFLISGRLGYVFEHFKDLGTIYRLFAFLAYPGISYLVGIFGAVVAILFFARFKEWDSWKVLDVLAVSIPITLVFGFIGSFLNGSDPGISSRLGFVYPGYEGTRFPIDLVGIVWAIVSFVISVRVRKNFRFYTWYKGNASSAKDGLAFLVALFSFAIYLAIRGFLVDSLGKIGPVSQVHILSLAIIIYVGVTIYGRVGRTNKPDLLQYFRLMRRGGKK